MPCGQALYGKPFAQNILKVIQNLKELPVDTIALVTTPSSRIAEKASRDMVEYVNLQLQWDL